MVIAVSISEDRTDWQNGMLILFAVPFTMNDTKAAK
jgi:hypothetical protein